MTLAEPCKVCCPWCGTTVEIQLDPETVGEFVQDCEVCCRPWLVHTENTPELTMIVTIERNS